MDPASVIACVAVIGRCSQPLYLRVFSPDADALQLELAVFSALDTLDEKVPERRLLPSSQAPPPPPQPPAQGQAAAPPQQGFLGLLLHVEEYKVFGYATVTSARIVVVVRDVLLSLPSVRELFSRLHRAYADAAASPFAVSLDAPLTSPAFDAAVAGVVKDISAALLYVPA
jgi:hypothetical protein